jgi:hypothetical protein
MMNMPSVLKLIVAVFFLATLPAQLHALTPNQIFDKVKDSIVVVKTIDAESKIMGQGSGVLISTGRVATNCHVVQGGTSYQVIRGKEFASAILYAEDGDKDICILDISDTKGPRDLIAELAGGFPKDGIRGITGKPAQLGKAASLKVGVPVYAVGAPKGLELSISDGIVSQLRGGPPPVIQTTAAISPGSSGGGLFDGEGRLVGLTTLYITGGQSLNFAMPVEWIGEIKPGRKMVSVDRSKTDWLERSVALSKLKDWQGHLDWCQKWTKSEPDDATAWFRLGFAYDILGRNTDAIEAYRQAIRIDPEYTQPWNSLGVIYSELGRINDAIEALRQAIRIDPKNDYAWQNLGSIYSNLGRHNDAIEAYKQPIQIDPKNAMAWRGLGVAYLRSGNRNAAMTVVKELRRLNSVYWADELFDMIVPR